MMILLATRAVGQQKAMRGPENRERMMGEKSEAVEPAAVWVATDALKLWVKNPRKNDRAAEDVAKSIKRFGFASPIIARRADGEVIAGHTRLKAAILLGLPKVPVRYVDLDPAEAHLLALADNRLGEKADWDLDVLESVIADFSPDDIEIAGWSHDDLAKMGLDELDPEVSDSFGLPSDEKAPFQTMSFTLHDDQVETVKRAIDRAKSAGEFVGPNENSNGNALARACEAYLGIG